MSPSGWEKTLGQLIGSLSCMQECPLPSSGEVDGR